MNLLRPELLWSTACDTSCPGIATQARCYLLCGHPVPLWLDTNFLASVGQSREGLHKLDMSVNVTHLIERVSVPSTTRRTLASTLILLDFISHLFGIP